MNGFINLEKKKFFIVLYKPISLQGMIFLMCVATNKSYYIQWNFYQVDIPCGHIICKASTDHSAWTLSPSQLYTTTSNTPQPATATTEMQNKDNCEIPGEVH